MKLILSAKDRVVGVQGYAGTGKTSKLKATGNVLVALIDGLIEKGLFTTDEVSAILDRLEATVRRAEGEIKGDLAEEAEVAATMAIVDHLRDILFSVGSQTGPSS